jgi:hypothetical protein
VGFPTKMLALVNFIVRVRHRETESVSLELARSNRVVSVLYLEQSIFHRSDRL